MEKPEKNLLGIGSGRAVVDGIHGEVDLVVGVGGDGDVFEIVGVAVGSDLVCSFLLLVQKKRTKRKRPCPNEASTRSEKNKNI